MVKHVFANIYFEENGFGNYGEPVVFELIKTIDKLLSTGMGLKPFSSSPVVITHWNGGHPMIIKYKDKDKSHVIFLTVKDSHWCQFVFQFAHEYCHHLICGEMEGKKDGLIWFEEILCHTASLYCLEEIAACIIPDRKTSPLTHPLLSVLPTYYIPAFRDYVADLKKGGEYTQNFVCQLVAEGSLEIVQDEYPRENYSRVATSIVWLFHDNPFLWKILGAIGNIHRFVTLEDLFVHLLKEADTTWAASLYMLRSYFLYA